MRDDIRTKRLVLRELTLEDAPAFSKLAGDYDIAKMTGSIPHPFPLYSAEFKIMYMRRQKQRGLAYPYAITRDGGDGELIGVMDLFRSTPDAALEIGYWIGKPYWGQGLSTEAARAIIKEARETLGVEALLAGAFADNPASLRVLQKLGFKPTGIKEMYFSMARMQKARSINLRLDFEVQPQAVPLNSELKLVMSA